MKKMFLFAAMASVAFASCTTDESVFDAAKEQGKIEFVAANYAAQTRGGHGEDAFSNSDFSVYAWEKGTNYRHMDNVKMIPDGATDWKTENKKDYYWPNNTNLDFTAVSPANDPAYVGVTRSADGTENTLTFKFDATNKNTTTTNLMYADYVTENYDYDVDPAAPVVPLLFRHVLAKLKVVVHQNDNPNPMPNGIADYNVRVRKLYITDINEYGTLVLDDDDMAAAKTDAANQIWANQAGSATWNILGSAAVNDTVTTVTSVEDADYESTTDFANYYVMPQEVKDATKLTIEYVLTTEFETDVTAEKVYTKTIALNTIGSIANWYTNKYITYTINITPAALEPIKFSVTEENWCEDTTGDTTLQGEDEI